MTDWRPVITGLGFPEGPAVGPVTVCTDADTGAVVSPDGVLARVPGRILGAAWRDAGTLLVARADPPGVLEVDVPGGRIRTLVDEPGLRLVNDLAVAADGTLWFTDTGAPEDWRGGLWRLGTGGPERVLELAHANGVVLDGDRVYVAETTARRVLALDPDGTVRVHARMTGGVGPDGLAVDGRGRLYAAHYGAGVVGVFDRDGAEAAAIPVPGANPTNVTFGPDGALYVTEAETGTLWMGLIAT